jgi:hypothetical protein
MTPTDHTHANDASGPTQRNQTTNRTYTHLRAPRRLVLRPHMPVSNTIDLDRASSRQQNRPNAIGTSHPSISRLHTRGPTSQSSPRLRNTPTTYPRNTTIPSRVPNDPNPSAPPPWPWPHPRDPPRRPYPKRTRSRPCPRIVWPPHVPLCQLTPNDPPTNSVPSYSTSISKSYHFFSVFSSP